MGGVGAAAASLCQNLSCPPPWGQKCVQLDTLPAVQAARWGVLGAEPDTCLRLTLSAGFLGSSCVPGLPVLWGHLQHSGSCQTAEVLLSSSGLRSSLSFMPCCCHAQGLRLPLSWGGCPILSSECFGLSPPLWPMHAAAAVTPLRHSNGLHVRRGQTLWPGYTSQQCLDTLLTPPLTTSSS